MLISFVPVLYFVLQFSISPSSGSGSSSFDENLVTIINEESQEESLFGYSVALVPSVSRGTSGWIFIGAPKSTGNDPKYTENGVVYRCKLDSMTCDRLDFSSQLCSDRTQRRNDGTCKSSFLGGVLRTSARRKDPNLLVCAPTWNRIDWRRNIDDGTDLRTMEGACSMLTYSEATASSLPQSLGLVGAKVNPFKSIVQYRDPEKEKNSKVWWLAGAGFAGYVNSLNRMLIGAPGVRIWNGTVLAYKTDSTPEEMQEFRVFNPQDFSIPDYDSNTKLTHLNLMGYAVSAGKYLDKTTELVAAAAPNTVVIPKDNPNAKNKHMDGLVLLLSYEHTKPRRDTFWSKPGKKWSPKIIKGTQFGSYFGSTLESIDINGDGMEELMVGAPYYTNKNEMGGDHGCVFIYSVKWSHAFEEYSQMLCGSLPGGQFGISIAGLGDLNLDGFQDFAVGAPYESDTGGSVYIYFGRDMNQALKSVRIRGRRYSPTMIGFGYGISGGIDIDGNGTPDFSVGSYKSKSTIIFRTRPTLKLNSTLTPYIRDPKESSFILPKETTTFFIKWCVKIEISPHEGPAVKTLQDILVWGRISVDFDDHLRRFWLTSDKNNSSIKSHFSRISFRIREGSNQKCDTVTLTRKVNRTEFVLHEDDIHVSHSLWYNGTNTTQLNQFVTTLGVGSSQAGLTARTIRNSSSFEEFCATCPYPMSQSFGPDTIVFVKECKRAGDTKLDDSIPICQPAFEVTVAVWFRNSENLNLPFLPYGSTATLGEFPWLILQVNITNVNQTAYFPGLNLTWWWNEVEPNDIQTALPSLSFISPEQLCEYVQNATIGEEITCKLDASKPYLGQNQTKTLLFGFNMALVEAYQLSPLQLGFQASAYLQQDPEFIPAVNEWNINFKADAGIRMEGYLVNRTMPISLHNSLSYSFLVKRLGVTNTPLKLHFLLPTHMTRRGKSVKIFSLYEPRKELTCTHNLETPSIVSNLNRSILTSNKTLENMLDKNCGEELKSCLYIYCELTKGVGIPNKGLEVTFDLDIINSAPLLGLKESVTFPGFAYASLFGDEIVSTTISVLLINPDPRVIVAVWIVIAAGVGSFLILILMVLILYRCGFFKREAKNKLVLRKAEAEMEDAGFTFQTPDGSETQKMAESKT